MKARELINKICEGTGDWYPINHPHNKPPGQTCRKCGSARVSLPAYNGDYFDCLDCGNSWPQTDVQDRYMRDNPASFFDKRGRRPADIIKRIRNGGRVPAPEL